MVLKLLFANRENRHAGPSVEFLKDALAQGHVKSLNKDRWNVLYEFSHIVGDTFFSLVIRILLHGLHSSMSTLNGRFVFSLLRKG